MDSLWIPMGLLAAHHHSMPWENLRGPEVTSQVRDLKPAMNAAMG